MLLIYICGMDQHNMYGRLDKIGITASTLCAIHCAVVPIIFTSLPLIGLGFLALPWVEWGMIIFALMVGVYSIGASYLRTHHKPLPLILLLIGFAIILLGHAFLSTAVEGFVVPIGGMVIALAHFVNYKCVGASPKQCSFHEHRPSKLNCE